MDLNTILAIIFLAVSASGAIAAAPDQPLIHRNDMSYLGAFRLPEGNIGGGETANPTFASADGSLAYRPPAGSNGSMGSLFVMTKNKYLAEIQIPENILSVLSTHVSTVSSLPQATTVLQSPSDPTNGNWNNIASGGSAIENGSVPGGILATTDTLYGSVYAYYNTHGVYSHFASGSALGTNFTGFSNLNVASGAMTGNLNPNIAGGSMGWIPSDWRSSFGGASILTGKGNASMVATSSQGNCAIAFNPSGIGNLSTLSASPVVCYPSDYPTIGAYSNFNPNIINNGASGDVFYYAKGQILNRGTVFPVGTSTVLFFGTAELGAEGTGSTGYGGNTTDITVGGGSTFAGAISSPSAPTVRMVMPGSGDCPSNTTNGCFYDPSAYIKGPHGYPYYYAAWAYDAQYMAKVYSGDYVIQSNDLPNLVPSASSRVGQTLQFYDLMPYAHWPLSSWTIDPYVSYTTNNNDPLSMLFPTPSTGITNGAEIGGVAYDPTNQLVYILTLRNYKINVSYIPIIHVFHISVPSGGYVGNTLPALTTFNVPSESNSLSVTGITMSGINNPTDYCIVTKSSAGECEWSNIPLNSYTFPSAGKKVLYGYTRNASGVSNVIARAINIASGGIDGICGSSNGLALSSAPTIGLCTAGTASAVSGTGPWSWTCAGSGGGSTANCSATLLEIPSGGASAAVACSAIAGFR